MYNLKRNDAPVNYFFSPSPLFSTIFTFPSPSIVMSPSGIQVECKDVSKALDRLKAELKSRTVIMPGIGEYMMNQAKDRIKSRQNTAPDGSKWESLAASTIRAKQKAGKGDKGILEYQPALRKNIGFQVTSDDTVSIGSSMLYAMIHQRGGMAGLFSTVGCRNSGAGCRGVTRMIYKI